LTCNDPNASKYGETSASGDCGSCNSGYARDSSGGACKKQGCTTDDDYNFDPEAEIHVESMCGGTTATTEQDPSTQTKFLPKTCQKVLMKTLPQLETTSQPKLNQKNPALADLCCPVLE
jgi:hypothetical protein